MNWLALAIAAFVGALVVEHQIVKLGTRHAGRVGLQSLTVAALMALGAPPIPTAQTAEIPVGLPDLASDPPFVWFDRVFQLEEGPARLISFDGHIRNIGEGVLELHGNPQIPGDVQQRYFDGEDWVNVASPQVIYETTDDHNHFHLMAAAEYSLWDEGQLKELAPSSKVGFCLVDVEQRGETTPSFYDIDTINYCNTGEPDSTSLTMGISPGWMDIYDANTTLQWVDVSDTPPGRYHIGARTDPLDQIVESDETNNATVFSVSTFAVDGYNARPSTTYAIEEPILLRSDPVGDVGEAKFEIVDPPAHGTLSVPVGMEFGPDVVLRYRPSASYDGSDSFTFTVRDRDSSFPRTRTRGTAILSGSASSPAPLVDRSGGSISGPTSLNIDRYEQADETLDSNLEGVVWLSSGLPAGIFVDSATGQLSGVATEVGSGTAHVFIVDSHDLSGRVLGTHQLSWQVADANRPKLEPLNELSTRLNAKVRNQIGIASNDATYTANNLPPGIDLAPAFPMLTGSPTEAGSYDVRIEAVEDGEIVGVSEFTWTVRNAAEPAFVL